MNILNLSLDQALLNNSHQGDTLDRFKVYSKYCHKFIVLIPTTKLNFTARKKINKKIDIYTAQGSNKYFAYIKLLYLSIILVRGNNINLIIANDFITAVIGKLATIFFPTKVQLNVFGLPLIQRKWLFSSPSHPIIAIIQLIAIYWSDSIRTDSTREARQLNTIFKINSQKIIALPVPPNPKIQHQLIHARPKLKLRKQFLNHADYLILSVGTLNPNKDFPNLIKSTELLVKKGVKVKTLIVGHGVLKNNLQQMVSDLRLQKNVEFYGPATYQQLIELYQSADIFVSSSFLEGLPRVIMEAALSGLPIVATDTSGISGLIVNYKSGIIVPISSPQQLSKAIYKLLKHHHLAQQYASAAKKHAIKYLDFDTNLKHLVQNWLQLVNQ